MAKAEFVNALMDKAGGWLKIAIEISHLDLQALRNMEIGPMRALVKIGDDMKITVEANSPLTGSQALDLGKRLIEKGAVAVAREAVAWPSRGRSHETPRATTVVR